MRTAIATVLALALALMVAAVPAQAANVVHRGKYWSWAGPKSWSAGEGVYGITVLGNKAATLDLGFSSLICAKGNTWDASVTNYFNAKRAELRKNGAKLTKTGKIVKVKANGANYRRQNIQFTTKSGKKKLQGMVILDYDYTTTVDGLNYCYQRSEARSSNKAAWKKMKSKLAGVSRSLAYFGPGAYEDPK